MKGDKKIIYLVGMGPGNFDMMTDQAIQAEIGRASCRERV